MATSLLRLPPPGTLPPTEADARCGRDPAPTRSSAAHRPAGPRRHPVTARTRPLRVSETPPASTALTKIATALPGTLFSPRQPSPRTSGVYAARLSLSSIRPCRGFAPSRYGAFSSAVTRRSSSRSRSTCRTETSRTTWETGLVILRTRWARSSPPAPALLSPSEPAEPLLITGSPTIAVTGLVMWLAAQDGDAIGPRLLASSLFIGGSGLGLAAPVLVTIALASIVGRTAGCGWCAAHRHA